MIFLTVGTDHHQFYRLMKEIDRLFHEKIIDKMIVQYGYNNFVPRCSKAFSFLPFNELMRFMKKADIIITHGSSTAMLAIMLGKIPIVVPRNSKYNEAIDDHQVEFAKAVEGILPMLVLYNVQDLEYFIKNYHQKANLLLERLERNNDQVHLQDAIIELHKAVLELVE